MKEEIIKYMAPRPTPTKHFLNKLYNEIIKAYQIPEWLLYPKMTLKKKDK